MQVVRAHQWFHQPKFHLVPSRRWGMGCNHKDCSCCRHDIDCDSRTRCVGHSANYYFDDDRAPLTALTSSQSLLLPAQPKLCIAYCSSPFVSGNVCTDVWGAKRMQRGRLKLSLPFGRPELQTAGGIHHESRISSSTSAAANQKIFSRSLWVINDARLFQFARVSAESSPSSVIGSAD
jgi:hypothetical protein